MNRYNIDRAYGNVYEWANGVWMFYCKVYACTARELKAMEQELL